MDGIDHQATPSSANAFRMRRLSIAVLVVLVALSVAVSLVIRSIVADQAQRILNKSAGEVSLVLDTSIQSVAVELPIVGAAVSSGAGSAPGFARVAASLVKGSKSAVAVAVPDGRAFRVIAKAGVTPIEPTITGVEAALLQRAMRRDGLASALVGTGTHRVLLIASRTPYGTVVLDVSPLGPVKTSAAPPPGTPFSDLRIALYVESRPVPSALIVTSGGTPTGAISRQFLTVGSDRWLLLVSAAAPLVGSIAAWAPWATLFGALLATVLVTVLIDILARRRAYAMALVAERTGTLEKALREREQLQEAERQAREEAEAANRSKNEFLSRMSHELRTPLNAVIGFGQLLERESITNDQRVSVAHILKGGHHLLGLINDVLDIARIETGDLALSQEPVLVSDLLADVLGLVSPLADQRGIHLLKSRGDAVEEYVLADRHRLQQVLLNLLSNAVKYNRMGGSVAVSCERPTPTTLRINVTDTGPGIPSEQLAQLFVPFERLGAERSSIEGTGIGLTLSRQLAEAMGGTLDLTTEVSRGSTFWVELPRAEGPVERYERLAVPHIGEHAVTPPSTGPTRRVIYIEDNLANLSLVQRILAERERIEIIPAMQGRLGLELAQEHQPSLILLDLHLPDISGDEVLHRLREDPLTAHIPVVIVTADATPGHLQRLLNAGALAYLTKPLDVSEILALIDEHVLGDGAALTAEEP
jgi:signal transduction histidine kinase/CheY-like chemotaxis protein